MFSDGLTGKIWSYHKQNIKYLWVGDIFKISDKTIGGERRFESYPAASKMEAGSQVVRQPPTILFEK